MLTYGDLISYHCKTLGNCTYFLTVMEDKSRSTWIFLLADKAQVSTILRAFFVYLKTHFLVTPKVLRTYNGIEFVNKERSQTLAEYGILHEKTCVYTP